MNARESSRGATTQLSLALAISSIMFAAQVAAQEAQEAPGQLEEVVVTAQKRSQALEEVPIAISAFSGDELTNGRVMSVNQLATMVPGMRVDSQGGASQPTVRGVGTATAGAGATSNIAVYGDGFYIPDQYDTDLQLLNLKSVQVLKGPQGTLFGRNATGGAILLETLDPTFDPSFEVQLTGAKDNDYLVNAYGSSGLTDTIAVDAAVIYRQGDGFLKNIATGADDDGKFDRTAVRVSGLYKDDNGLKVRLAYTYSSSDEPIYSAMAAWKGNSLAAQYGPIAGPALGIDTVIATKDWKVSNTAPTGYTTDSSGVYLTIEKDFGDIVFKSLTMDRSSQSRTQIDLDSSNLPIFAVKFKPVSSTFSQEFDLTGTTGAFDWVVGAFFMSYDDKFDYLDATQALMPINPPAPPYFVVAQFPIYDMIETKDDSYAAFADVTYAVTDKLFLTAGLRYSYEDISARVKGLYFPGNNIPEWTHDWNNTSPRFVARYQIDDDTSVYASWSQGFKAGMLQPSSFTTVPVDPEKISAWEIGYKTRRGTWQFNTSAFYYDYKDMQVASFNGTQALYVNAAASTIYGADFQLTALLTDGLTAGLGAAYTHGRYDKFPNSQARDLNMASPTYLQVISGSSADNNPMMRTPEFTLTANLGYEKPLSKGSMQLNADYYYTDSFYFDPNKQFEQGSYGLLNLRAGWVSPGGKFSATLFWTNVTNEQYVATLLPGDFAIQQMYGAPESYGLTLGYKY
jgi:iron complex outermembrane recepter protein